jgi:hypothetical protein
MNSTDSSGPLRPFTLHWTVGYPATTALVADVRDIVAARALVACACDVPTASSDETLRGAHRRQPGGDLAWGGEGA